ncbi:MAG: hypothetical protein ABJN39_09975 [Sulfitobacter sp.]|uniref:hypothetical protein n=1 Tax=unclassified Sulfitobacter TaxID=196795 RepID=UPI000EEF3F46|nr:MULTISPECIES: hypothetical protein [unclassified Sulfitobacter]WOI16983.1 hypothetical protein R1T45_11550 [Sulfitobacter sp. LC.270.F.C4]HCQ58298.1 hypothetical protein [Sulfitobacter sp.]|tara:strand:- start:1 stop:522 length:522 start_codon:yes stop_codon:yes gene_type:complete
MTRIILPLFIVAATAGCSTLSDRLGMDASQSEPAAASAPTEAPAEAATAPAAATPPAASPIATGGSSAEALDTTTAAEREAASRAPASTGAALGTTVVSLGSATEPGLWLKTPLVDAEQPGRVTNPATGKSAAVTLIPLDGPATAGSRMSLPALRLIGASLTDLTTVEVSTAG